ncbi:MAG: hypothetical protein AAFQ64_15865 [Pseudomonadota bacterium]
MQTEGYIFYGAVVLVFGLLFFLNGRRTRLIERRRKSLRYDQVAGVYMWCGLDGVQRTSVIHPNEPGGDWFDPENFNQSSAGEIQGFGEGGFGGEGGSDSGL